MLLVFVCDSSSQPKTFFPFLKSGRKVTGYTARFDFLSLTPLNSNGRNSVVGTDWTALGSNSTGCKRFLSSPKRPDRLFGPPSLLFSWYRGNFSGVSDQGVMLTTRLHLVPSLKMSGDIPPLSQYAFIA
jgi:hypothetical protein